MNARGLSAFFKQQAQPIKLKPVVYKKKWRAPITSGPHVEPLRYGDKLPPPPSWAGKVTPAAPHKQPEAKPAHVDVDAAEIRRLAEITVHDAESRGGVSAAERSADEGFARWKAKHPRMPPAQWRAAHARALHEMKAGKESDRMRYVPFAWQGKKK